MALLRLNRLNQYQSMSRGTRKIENTASQY